MKTITAAVDEKYVEAMDAVIKSTGLYTSRSELIKDAVRSKVAELNRFEEARERIRATRDRMRKKIKFYRPLTQEMRDKLAEECIEK